MEDSDDIRQLIEQRIERLHLDKADVSRRIGKGRTYLHDYFVKRSPKALPHEQKLKLAAILKISPAMLGIPAMMVRSAPQGGMAEDAVPYQLGPHSVVPPPHIVLFRMQRRTLDQHPLRLGPGKVLAFNTNNSDPAQIAPGTVVIAELVNLEGKPLDRGPIVRQFLPPAKLVTNSSEQDEIISLRDPKADFVAVIKGTMTYAIDEVLENGARQPAEAQATASPKFERSR